MDSIKPPKNIPISIWFWPGERSIIKKLTPAELKARSRKLPSANRFHFTGFISEAELNWLYDLALALILPYTLSISSSLPLTFAFQHGKPVLASSIGTLRDEIQPSKDGLLFTPRSAPAIAGAIDK